MNTLDWIKVIAKEAARRGFDYDSAVNVAESITLTGDAEYDTIQVCTILSGEL